MASSNLWRGQFTSYTAREGLPADYVSSVIEDHQGTVWIAHRRGSRLVPRMGACSRLAKETAFRSRLVSALAEDLEHHLWVGTEVGVFRSTQPINCLARTVRSAIRQGDRHVRQSACTGIATAPSGSAPTSTGLVAYRDGRMTKYTTKDGLPSNVVRGMQQDRDGSLWFGTRGGGLVHFKDGKFTTYTRQGRAGRRPFIVSLFMDRDNTLWIGTRQGLNRLKDGKFTTYTVKDGLYASFVYNIVEDDHRLSVDDAAARAAFRVSKKELNDFADGKITSVTVYRSTASSMA